MKFQKIILFYFSIQLSSAICPDDCICADTNVVCTCSDKSQMTLGSFRNLEFASKIFIHNCQNLTIPASTFSGLSISHELSITSVKNLNLDQFAFRDMIRYPDKFSIVDCAIPIFPPNFFFGFHKTKHVWFVNVNVSRIAEGAFRHVTDIDYFYIRESNIGRVESHAFSNMTNIGHFFVRGNSKIDRTESSAFHYSNFGKIIFEDVRIRLFSNFAFNGPLRYDSMLFDNVTIGNIDFLKGNQSLENFTSARKLEFLNCYFKRRFSLSVLCSNVMEVKFQNSHIDRLVQSPLINLRNITRLRFIDSSVNAIEPFALNSTKDVDHVIFDHCRLKSIQYGAFAQISGMSELTFHKCNIDQFPKFNFEKSSVEKFTVSDCDLVSIEPQSFIDSKFDQLRFAYSKIKIIANGAFNRVYANYFGLEHVRLNLIKENFYHISVENFNMSNCKIGNQFDENFMTGSSLRFFTLNSNALICSCDSKFTTQLRQLKRYDYQNFLSVKNNLCIDSKSNWTSTLDDYSDQCKNLEIDSDQSISIPGLRCSKYLFLISCICERNFDHVEINESIIKKVDILHNASIFIISYCKRLKIRNSAMRLLSLSRVIIDKCDLVELDAHSLLQKSGILLIRLSNIDFIRIQRFAFSPNQLDVEEMGNELEVSYQKNPFQSIDNWKNRFDIEFINCTIEKITSGAFEKSIIGNLNFFSCDIGIFEPLVGKKSIINQLSIEKCKVGKFSSGVFNETVVENLNIEKCEIYELENFLTDKLRKNSFICFSENRLACDCDITGIDDLSDANGCQRESNICIGENSEDALKIKKYSKREGDECNYGQKFYEKSQRDTPEFFHSSQTGKRPWSIFVIIIYQFLFFM